MNDQRADKHLFHSLESHFSLAKSFEIDGRVTKSAVYKLHSEDFCLEHLMTTTLAGVEFLGSYGATGCNAWREVASAAFAV